MNHTPQQIEDAKKELARAFFNCAVLNRPTTYWRSALDKFCETYIAPQPCPKCEWHVEEAKIAKAEINRLSAIKYKHFSGADCWIYQGDGEDHLDSLVCPVVIAPKQLLELQAKVSELEKDLQTTSDALGHADSNDRELIEEQLGTIKALNIALGGEDSTSTENLIDAYEVDYNEEGLISLCRKLVAENVRMGDTIEFQKAGWSADYDKLTRAEAVIEKCAYGLEFEKDSITFLMEWCVKNINRWSFPAFDNLHAAINRRQEALAAITEYREGK